MRWKDQKLDAVQEIKGSQKAAPLTTPLGALDAGLTSLFATSAGPIFVSPRRFTGDHRVSKTSARITASSGAELPPSKSSPSCTTTSSLDPDSDSDDTAPRSRKRRRIETSNDIEGAYLRRLAVGSVASTNQAGDHSTSTGTASTAGKSADKALVEVIDSGERAQVPQHESLSKAQGRGNDDSDRDVRTVFLGNVSIEAVKSKSAKKALLKHISTGVTTQSDDVPIKIESLRFRSTAFASGVGPKRAAYAKRELMEETTRSTNAYVVYATQDAAEKAVKSLNGSVVLDRHLRADLVASPATINHRRCIFVGNLAFVDEETVETETTSGGKETKKKAKHPADAEEGLWRTFSKIGEVESVRVIRDQATRVGKGIAYVQFCDENSVEAALLYNDKKFPPLLPRKLRVSRARKPKNMSERSFGGQARNVDSKNASQKRNNPGNRSVSTSHREKSEQSRNDVSVVFEGHRATKPSVHGAKRAKGGVKHGRRPTTRSSRRGTAFKAAGGKLKK